MSLNCAQCGKTLDIIPALSNPPNLQGKAVCFKCARKNERKLTGR